MQHVHPHRAILVPVDQARVVDKQAEGTAVNKGQCVGENLYKQLDRGPMGNVEPVYVVRHSPAATARDEQEDT